ncbi:MAG: hypothetical protein ABSF27_06875 [Candidatus Dormibacteria bacterium]
MLYNPPPDRCDQCKHSSPNWILVEGPEQSVELNDGHRVVRRGRVYVCGACGHTVPVSSEGFH